MPKKLDNSFSFSPDEFINKIKNSINEIDINVEVKKYVKLVKEYLNDDKLFDDWENYFGQEIHSSIPSNVKDNCKVCNGTSNLEKDEECKDYYSSAHEFYHVRLVLYVNFIEINKHLFKSKQTLFSLTNEFFKTFKFSEGELTFNAKSFDNILITHTILELRDSFKDMDTQEAINIINDSIEEIETHKIVATSTNRILSDLVKPQLKFLKKQLKYYNKKLLTEPVNSDTAYSPRNDDDKCIYKDYTNFFQKSMPIEIAVNHFKIFTTKKSKNGKPFLTNEQLDVFIKKAFCGNTDLPKQSFNQLPKGEKFIIQYRFREFYDIYYWEYFGTQQVQEKFIKLLTDNFTDWDYQSVKNNFKKKPKKTLQLL